MAPNQFKKNPKAAFCVVIATFCFVGFITLFTIGGVFFSQEHPKVVNYANSMCQVDSWSVKYYQCKSRYYSYTCYGPIWNVHLSGDRPISAVVEGSRRYRSYSEASNKAYKYQVRSSYSCWYDTRNPSVAQWDKPSTLVAVILLGCGGLSVLLFVLFVFLAYRLVKQQNIQNEQNDFTYSPPNYYNKQ